MSEFLFVYGTLRPGCAPDEIANQAARLRLVGEASIQGNLYDLGHFPGALLSNDSVCRIPGLLFELPEDEHVLQALDEYEEFIPARPRESQFVRVRCEAQLKTGEAVTCWIYVYTRSIAAMQRIVDGVWRGPAH